ncbi:AAA family ATPase [Azospirillum canadense]|uniref:AAA family ATPase n=1 Tax=Azospirillum canadense TaxID=403962 RepID=UPI0022262D09|nr:AAA family ATPase [Azospirillum canadense]MCW2244198.1 exonuclease SbcC [Azospirillum canadense]
MRILAVRGCNLASLDGSFAVDLDHGPLRNAGLFAITGPTGAGKSTILDALCLALFDKMPRLPDGRGVQLGRDGDPDAILTTDVRTILRRGAGSGWAEVDFVGIDGSAYRARWELRRARQNARGQLQKQAMSLSSLDGTKRFGDGKTSVLEEIATRLGLSFEQFRRAVLLAQGDFATFLKAPARERSALLELLTGTEIYSRLSIAAHERNVAEQRALEALEAQCDGIGVLGETERATLETEAIAATVAVHREEAALDVARAAVAWHERDGQLAASEAAATAQAVEADRVWQEAEPRRREAALLRGLQPLRALLAEADRCARESVDARDALARAEATAAETQQALEQAAERHAEARAAFESACLAQEEADPDIERAAALDAQIATLSSQTGEALADVERAKERVAVLAKEGSALQVALDAARRDAADRERWLADQAPFAPVAEQWARWDALLARCGDTLRAHRDAEDRQRRCTKDAAAHEDALVRKGEARTEAQAKRDAAQARVAALRAEPVVALDDIRRRRTALSERRDALAALARLAEGAGRVATQIAEAEAEHSRHGDAAAQSDALAGEARAALDRTRAVLGEAEATLRRLHLARREDVRTLRAQLVEGDACPVCGSTQHPWADASPLAQLADDQEDRVAALRTEVTDLVKAHGAQEASARSARERVAGLERTLESLRRERRDLLDRWTNRASEADLPVEPAVEEVVTRLATVDAERAEVGRDEAVALDHKGRFDAAIEECRAQDAALADVNQAIEALTRQRDAARHAVDLATAARDQAARGLEDARTELAVPFAALEGWEAALRTDPQALRVATGARVVGFLAQREAHAKAVRDGEALDRQVAAKTVESDGARHAEDTARRRADGLAGELRALREARAGLLGGRAVADVKKELADARVRADALVNKATIARQDAVGRLSAARQDHATRSETARRCADAAGAAAAALADAATTRSMTVEEARAHLARGEEWLTAEEKALADLGTAQRDAALLAAERTRLREEHRATSAPAGTAEEAAMAVAVTSSVLQEARGRLGEAQARLRADTENRARLVDVLHRVEAQRKTHALWATMAQLIGSRDGMKFRNFAQSLSLDLLLVQANRYLGDLARRYRLERVAGADLEIQVVDGEMGDERRGVHSLSGGEMFLVSLALALGLSAMAGGSGGGGIGTLFIDEGFGTLDPDSLDLALSCLEALQATGRQVGVISHVPALVERIGVQVRVMPLGGGRSSVSVTNGTMAGAAVATDGTASGPMEREALLPL